MCVCVCVRGRKCGLGGNLRSGGRLGRFRGERATQSGGGARQLTQEEETKKRRKVEAANGRHNAPEDVQERVRHGKDGLEQRNALGLREPGKQNAEGDHVVVQREEGEKATDEGLLHYAVAGDRHRQPAVVRALKALRGIKRRSAVLLSSACKCERERVRIEFDMVVLADGRLSPFAIRL